MRFQFAFFREAAGQWSKHNASSLGAALAYYSVLSLAPLLVVVVAISGLAFGQEAVRGQVYGQIKDLVGSQSASIIQSLLKQAHRPGEGILASALGFLTLILGASGVFSELRDTLNYIWGAPVKTSFGIGSILRYRFFSFAMVLGIGFLLLISLAFSTVIQALGTYASHHISMPAAALETINFIVTFLVTSVMFAMIYKFIPEVPIDWSDVAIGSVVTSIFFSVGKFLLGFYLGTAGVGSAYGAAGSLVVLLVWVYYSSQIFLFGAEFTHVYALHKGSPAIQNAITNVGLKPGT